MGSVSSIEKLYTKDYFNGAEYVAYQKSANIYKLNLQRKLQAILSSPYFYGKPRKEILDEHIFELGAATGEFLKILRKQKFKKIQGAEISQYCRKTAAHSGFNLLDPNAKGYLRSIKRFNPTIVCAWDVWEHLENPQSIFKKIISTNPKISVIALTTVDSGALIPRIREKRWRQFHPPTHLNYPSKKSFEVFFESVGFKIRLSKSFGYYRPIADYLSVLIGRKRMSALSILFKLPIYLNLYDIQLLVVERAR
jgi:hypothetical protein